MFKIILIALVVIVAALLIFISMKPDDFVVTRSATISASQAVVFAQVNDFHKWETWSPWAKIDPNIKGTYSGPEAGVGAKYAWVGNKEVGEGNMTIEDSKPNESIKIRLEFIKPFAGVNDTFFTFKPEGDKTLVTWTMSGKSNFMMKGMSLFIDCDKMCGDMFVTGLANLDAASQAAAKQ